MGGFPPSAIGVSRPNLEQFGGWQLQILGYIEQPQIYAAYNMNWGFHMPVNQTAVRTVLNVYVCPSTPRPAQAVNGVVVFSGSNGTPDTSLAAAPGDYFTARSYVDPWNVPSASRVEYTGALDQTVHTPFQSITDGLSNTMLSYECAGKPDHYYLGKLAFSFPNPNSPQVADRWFSHGAWAGFMNMRIISFHGDQQDFDGPCVINCHNGWNAVYSFHSGGVNTLLCDGSVRFLKETAAKSVIKSLVSKAGSEVLSADQY